MMARFCGILKLKKKKKRCQTRNFLGPRLRTKQARERERERAYDARKTILPIFFYFLCCTNS